jgi:hypothetical protein
MSKHTQGTWGVYAGPGHYSVETVSDEGEYSGCLANMEEYDNALADARVMAAAPDLLGALKLVLSRETPGHEHDWTTCALPSCAIARAAIAKAEGK